MTDTLSLDPWLRVLSLFTDHQWHYPIDLFEKEGVDFEIGRGTFYVVIHRLVEDGLLQVEQDRVSSLRPVQFPRRKYRITEEGQKRLKGEIA